MTVLAGSLALVISDDHVMGRCKDASQWIVLEFVVLKENIAVKQRVSPQVGFTGKEPQPGVRIGKCTLGGGC